MVAKLSASGDFEGFEYVQNKYQAKKH